MCSDLGEQSKPHSSRGVPGFLPLRPAWSRVLPPAVSMCRPMETEGAVEVLGLRQRVKVS